MSLYSWYSWLGDSGFDVDRCVRCSVLMWRNVEDEMCDEKKGGFHKKLGLKRVNLYNEQSHLEMDDDWGYPYDLGNLHIAKSIIYSHWRSLALPFVADFRKSTVLHKLH